MGQQNKNYQIVRQTVDYTLTNAYAQVTDLTLPVLKTGYYSIYSKTIFIAAAVADDCLSVICINGVRQSNTTSWAIGAAIAQAIPMINFMPYVYLEKGQIVALYAYYLNAGGKLDKAVGLYPEYYGTLEITEI
jgi:hypothetical protein